MIDIQHYRQRLLALERTVAARTGRALAAGSGAQDPVHDAGEASLADEVSSETFAAAAMSASTLAQIRAALVRLDAGTFGACAVDGAPIDEARLAAVPWTAYCLAHAELAEQAGEDVPTRMHTL
jgi:RNA polymerase-binding transcription factor DksA